MGDAPAGARLRLRHDVLAAVARLASGRCVAPLAARAPEPPGRRRPDRLEPGRAGFLHGAGKKGGGQTGPNPTDRPTPGTKRHLVVDPTGVPLAARLSAANVHDVQLLEAVLDAIPPIHRRRGRPRFRPAKLHADKGYDYHRAHAALRRRGIMSRIARKGIHSSARLGRHRWVVERTVAWLNQMKRLIIRYERRADIHEAFLTLGCSLICCRYLQHTFC